MFCVYGFYCCNRVYLCFQNSNEIVQTETQHAKGGNHNHMKHKKLQRNTGKKRNFRKDKRQGKVSGNHLLNFSHPVREEVPVFKPKQKKTPCLTREEFLQAKYVIYSM